VKPPAFQYHRVRTAEEALELLAELGDEGRVLAGGQSLVPLMNFRLAHPENLVDINPVEEFSYIRRDDGVLAVGATARQSGVEFAPEAIEGVPLLVEALKSVAHPPIRHRGTVVGSIAHADPAAELPTIAVATHATLVLSMGDDRREVAAEDFFLGPFETVLEPGEMVIEVRFPLMKQGSGFGFVEYARRHGDFAIAGAAVTLELAGGQVADATIALCSVGPRPVRASAAEDLLRGREATPELMAEAAQRAVEGLTPSGDIHGGVEYRVGVARAQARRALLLALTRARGGQA
jgi:carbon-monoxide dehydrogenase medium subunit